MPAQLSQSDLVDWFTSRGGPWRQVARANQLAPQRDDWDTWLLCAGRGFGKTRTGAEWTIEEAIMNPGSRGALIAPTAADCRDIMVRGESGILACAPPGLVEYSPSNRLVTFTNGSTLTLYSAEEPDRLRGPQHHFAWCDELASWRRMRDTWDMMQMGLRLGAHPRTCVTTTPRPLPLVKELIKHPRSHITTGTTYDNIHNLAPTFRQMIEDRYEGTTLGRQELYAEILSDLPGAMVAMSIIEQHRVSLPPELDSVAVALDPAGTGKGDESGIVAVGKAGKDLYVLADKSGRMTPRESARAAWNLVEELDADVLVYEDNLGKAWIEEVLMGVWKESRDPHQMPALRRVTATVGKKLRAAPVTARYEQGRVHHVGVLGELEDQLCVAGGTLIETDRGPVAIEHVSPGDRVMTRAGWAPVEWSGQTGQASHLTGIHVVNCVLWTTNAHPVWDENKGRFVRADSVDTTSQLHVRRSQGNTGTLSRGMAGGGTWSHTGTTGMPGGSCCTAPSGRHTTALCLPATSSTTRITTSGTTKFGTFPASLTRSTGRNIRSSEVRGQTTQLPGEPNVVRSGRVRQLAPLSASTAGTSFSPRGGEPRFAPVAVGVETMKPVPVYNLMVRDGYPPEYYANGILVHNCTWIPEEDPSKSPDRIDAMVHAATHFLRKERSMGRMASPPTSWPGRIPSVPNLGIAGR